MIVLSVLCICVISSVVLVLKWCYVQYRILKYMGKFPKPQNTTFLLGNMTELSESEVLIFRSFRGFAKDLFPHYSLRILHFVAVNILTPEDCEIFMNTKKHAEKSIIYDVMKKWLKDGLLVSNGDKWAKRRRILTPAFHFNILKVFIKVFNEETQNTLKTISKKCSEPIDVCTLSAEFTLRSICETAMGYKLNTEDERNRKYFEAVHEIGDLFRHRLVRPWLSTSFTYFFTRTYWRERKCLKHLHDFTRKIIRERMNTFEGTSGIGTVGDEDDEEIYMGTKKRRLAMLDVLLQAQKEEGSIDYQGICEEVDTFMFEGHDTTATAISFCLMLIANHPRVQNELLQEIQSILNGRTEPKYEDFQKMDYLERCIKESLRLYPSVFLISRKVEEDVILNSGLMVPKGALAHIHIFDILRNPRVYPRPDEFDPDRFLPENCQQRHPFAYIPFSAGPRNCIGQKFALLEMKALLTGILTNFILTPIDNQETVVLATNLVIRAKGGIKVKFTPRI